MGHSIRAIIGDSNTIKRLADNWVHANIEELPQNFAMIFLTDKLFDDVTELCDEKNTLDCSVLTYFTTSIFQLLCESSFRSQLLYIETDYFGGYGKQAAVLVQNGEIAVGPIKGTGIIDELLCKIGVQKEQEKDEFDSLGLGHYRKM